MVNHKKKTTHEIQPPPYLLSEMPKIFKVTASAKVDFLELRGSHPGYFKAHLAEMYSNTTRLGKYTCPRSIYIIFIHTIQSYIHHFRVVPTVKRDINKTTSTAHCPPLEGWKSDGQIQDLLPFSFLFRLAARSRCPDPSCA